MNRKSQSAKNILMVQDSSPCIRNIKISAALKNKGLTIHLLHKDKTPNETYGYGDSIYQSMVQLEKNQDPIEVVKYILSDNKIDLIHFHNQPDRLGAELIEASLTVPIVYDQHDFMSFKHRLTKKDKKAEKICNEQADGTIYITQSYKNEVAKYYRLIANSICFGNYFPSESALHPNSFLPKLSRKDDKVHLVYLGRISEHHGDHRNIINVLKKLIREDIIVNIYPSKNKKYRKYKKINNVIIHKKLPYKKLIQEISQYDYGMTVFNNKVASKLPHIRFAFGNKTYDYICAGLPVLVQDCLDEVKNFTLSNEFGFVLDQQEKYLKMNATTYSFMVNRILRNRELYSMENQIQRMIDFYNQTLETFHEET